MILPERVGPRRFHAVPAKASRMSASWAAEPLFLEATQLKTVRTVMAVLRADPIVVEVQEVGIGARNRRRPNVPAGADGIQCAVSFVMSGVAEARGCCLRDKGREVAF